MIDDHALARSRDAEVLALGDLMERVLRWIALQDGNVIQGLINTVEDDIEDLGHRALSAEHRKIAEAALTRQRDLLAIVRVQRL